jgi:hypothetical protein
MQLSYGSMNKIAGSRGSEMYPLFIPLVKRLPETKQIAAASRLVS